MTTIICLADRLAYALEVAIYWLLPLTLFCREALWRYRVAKGRFKKWAHPIVRIAVPGVLSLPFVCHPGWPRWLDDPGRALPDLVDWYAFKSLPTHFATPTLVQHYVSANGQGSAGAQQSPKFPLINPGGSLSGNGLILALTCNSAQTMAVPTDNKAGGSSIWLLATSATISASGNRMSIYYTLNCAAGITGVTETFSAATNFIQGDLSEWMNISAFNVGANTSNASTTAWSGGTLATTAAGLIVQFCDDTTGIGPNQLTSVTAGSGFTLLSGNIYEGWVAQWKTTSGSGSVTPSLTVSTANSSNSVSAAFSSAVQGTAAPATGYWIWHIMRVNVNGPAQGSSFTFQFPSQGNLLTAGWDAFNNNVSPNNTESVKLSGIVDGSGNSWASPAAALSEYTDSGSGATVSLQGWYSSAATTANGLTVTPTVNTMVHDAIGYAQLKIYDVRSPASGNAFDKAFNTNGDDQAATTSLVVGNTLTPGTANGWITFYVTVEFNSLSGISAPAAAEFDAVWPSTGGGASQLEEGAGTANYLNPDTSVVSVTWVKESTGNDRAWGFIAMAFKGALPTGNVRASGS